VDGGEKHDLVVRWIQMGREAEGAGKLGHAGGLVWGAIGPGAEPGGTDL
jgi:hypothetical protein